MNPGPGPVDIIGSNCYSLLNRNTFQKCKKKCNWSRPIKTMISKYSCISEENCKILCVYVAVIKTMISKYSCICKENCNFMCICRSEFV